ncbi:MAG: hypothetical protein KZQ75_12340 [Candidatus Thiodiazotropha sp. (ex Myrtea spinifera)]|nr:hypothetical protein [Candidatus Thiodiazotropha sp. (ex Myrtea spinifera)]
MKGIQHIYLYTLMLLAACMGILEVLINLQGKVVSDATQSVWSFVFIIVTILWAQKDADKKGVYKPFDFGFLIYIFWPVAFPWYLTHTRGVEGALLFMGFISLWLGPWVAGLVAYAYFT